MKLKAWRVWWLIVREAQEGGVPDRKEEVEERLRPGPKGTPEAPFRPSRWTLSLIRSAFDRLEGYTESGVWRWLRRMGLKLRSSRVQQWSPDPCYEAKVAHLLDCLKAVAQSPKEKALVFLDEMGLHRWPEPGRDWSLFPPLERRASAKTETPNNSQWRIIGALNAQTGQVDYLDAYVVGRAKVIEFYHQLDQAYSRKECLYVVQDNWSIHTHEEVRNALQTLPRIVPVFLPTYAPWLNPIEKLWRSLRQELLKLHRLKEDWTTLRAQVRGFLDRFSKGSQLLLRYVGLLGEGKLAQVLRGP
jgi:transposase